MIAQGIDQGEREMRAKQMIRVDQWMANMFGTIKAYDRRMDEIDRALKDQKAFNVSTAKWMVLASEKINGTKHSTKRRD